MCRRQISVYPPVTGSGSRSITDAPAALQRHFGDIASARIHITGTSEYERTRVQLSNTAEFRRHARRNPPKALQLQSRFARQPSHVNNERVKIVAVDVMVQLLRPDSYNR